MDDPILLDDWHPVASSEALAPGKVLPARLLGRDLALWRDASGGVHVWDDRCPHRGARFSIGRVEQGELVCAYHGWRFDPKGACTRVPSQPGQPLPRTTARAYAAREAYGLVWACVGEPRGDILPFPEHADPNLRKVVCGPYEVAASGPRIIENFLDMSHFFTVHVGMLGDPDHPEVEDYDVTPWLDGHGGHGVMATGCVAWQARPNHLARQSAKVEFTYRVVRPLTAILTKLPQAQAGFREAITMQVQPIGEELSRVWTILAMTDFESSDETMRDFQTRVFAQDKPIVENQVPLKLPLAPLAEVPVRADRMSLAYRKYLREVGLRYGVVPAE